MTSTFHRRLAMVLAKDGREQQESARLIGVTSSQLANWKRDVSPRVSIIAQLIEVLDVDGHWLMTGEGSMHPAGRDELGLRLDVINQISRGEVEPHDLVTMRNSHSAKLDQGQRDQLQLQARLHRESQAISSEIEKRLKEIETLSDFPQENLNQGENASSRDITNPGILPDDAS